MEHLHPDPFAEAQQFFWQLYIDTGQQTQVDEREAAAKMRQVDRQLAALAQSGVCLPDGSWVVRYGCLAPLDVVERVDGREVSRQRYDRSFTCTVRYGHQGFREKSSDTEFKWITTVELEGSYFETIFSDLAGQVGRIDEDGRAKLELDQSHSLALVSDALVTVCNPTVLVHRMC